MRCFIIASNISGLDMKNVQSLKKTPWLSAIQIGVGLAFASSGFAADVKGSKASATNTSVAYDHKKAPSFLFVVSADKAKISPLKDGKASLVIQQSDMKKVIAFSDRPYRIVKEITGSDLINLWPEGKNRFKKGPPNAIISADNLDRQIVVIHADEFNQGAQHLHLSGLTKGAIARGNLNSVVLTIDGCELKFRKYRGAEIPVFGCAPPSQVTPRCHTIHPNSGWMVAHHQDHLIKYDCAFCGCPAPARFSLS